MTTVNSTDRFFLLFCAIGLLPIALSYGASPALSLAWLFDFHVDSINLTHIFRAVMGLYLAMVLFWVLGASSARYTTAALAACAVFMLGLAAGRLFSLVADGLPHWLLLVYAGLELVLGVIALVRLRACQNI